MKKLLLLCEYPTLNGGERSMLSVLPEIRAAGYAPVVWAPGEGALAETLAGRALEVEPFDAWDSAGRRPLADLRGELDGVLARRRPDLVHANSLAMGRLSGPVVAARGIPSVSHLRDIIGLSARVIGDLNCHGRLLAVSQATRDHHVAAGIDPRKTHVLYNGVDLETFRPGPRDGSVHRGLGIAESAPLILTIGQLGLRKGQDVLLSAVPAVLRAFPDATFLLIGQRDSTKHESIDFERRLHRQAKAQEGRVWILGRRDDVPRLMREATLLVHPARQEPLGRVLLEAAAAGLAVVATDVGGTREIFPPEEDAARLIPADDPGALAGAVCELLSNAAARESLSQSARRRACAAFDAHQAAAQLIRRYDGLLGRVIP